MKNFTHYVLGLFLLLIAFAAFPQTQSSRDSLLNHLNNYQKEDSGKVDLLLKLAFSYYEKESEKILKYAEQARSLALKLQYNRGLANAYTYLGIAYYRSQQYRESYENYLKAVPIYEVLGDTVMICKTYGNIKIIFDDFEDLEKQLEFCLKVDEIAKKTNHLNLKIDAYLNFAFTYQSQKKYDIALKYFERALNLAQNGNQIPEKFDIQGYIGSILKDQKNYTAALSYLLKALDFYESADKYYYDQASINTDISLSYCGLGKYPEAEKYLAKSKGILSNLSLEDINALNFLAQSKIDSLKKDYKSALKNYQLYIQLNQDYKNLRQKKQIKDLKIWYESEKSLKEKEQLIKEEIRQKSLIQKQLLIILSLSLSLIIIVITIIVNYRQYKKVQSIRALQEKQKIEILEKNKDLEYLHKVKDKLFSVISHDLRSPIIGIQNMLTLINEFNLSPDRIKDFVNTIREDVSDTSELLNNLLQWSRIQMKGMEPEKSLMEVTDLMEEIIKQLEPVANSKQIALKRMFSLKVQLYCDTEMLKIVLRNLVSNAIKFSHPQGEILIGGFLNDHFVTIFVKDFGTGIDPQYQDKIFSLTEKVGEKGTLLEASTGLGLILCHDFVEKNGGKLWFDTEPKKGSTFYFSMPILTTNKPSGIVKSLD